MRSVHEPVAFVMSTFPEKADIKERRCLATAKCQKRTSTYPV